jgi:solute carrier family 35 protein F1/2
MLRGDVGVVEWLAMIGWSGTVVGTIQFVILEGKAVADTDFDWPAVGLFAGFTASMVIFYSLVPILIKCVAQRRAWRCMPPSRLRQALRRRALMHECSLPSLPSSLRTSSATMLNLSLLTSDFYAVFAGVFLFAVEFTPVYAVAFVLSASGILIYNLGMALAAHCATATPSVWTNSTHHTTTQSRSPRQKKASPL